MSREQTFVLVDGENCLHRALHSPGLNTLSRAGDGFPTGAMMGFFNILQRLFKTYGSRVMVAWEGGGSAAKRQVFAHYKGNRKTVEQVQWVDVEKGGPPVMDLRSYLDLFRALIQVALHRLQVPCGYAPGYEADDVLATWATKIQTQRPGTPVRIISNDGDLWQCVTEQCQVVVPMPGGEDRLIDPAAVDQKFGGALGVLWEKVLRGCTSDYVPPVEFIWRSKKQESVRAMYPRHLEKVLERKPQSFEELQAVLRELQAPGALVKEGFADAPQTAEQMERNRRLVELCRQCPVRPVVLVGELLERYPSWEAYCVDFGFRRFLNQAETWRSVAAGHSVA